MKCIEVSIEDGKMCAQLLNMLKVVTFPAMTLNDKHALDKTLEWFNGLVKGIATELQSQSKPKELPKVDFVPPPVKKKGKK